MRSSSAAPVFVALIASAAWANWNDTATGVDLTKLRAFPLTKVRSGLLKPGEQVRFDGLVARMSSPVEVTAPDVVLSGRGKSGKAWAVHFSAYAFDQVFRGDLDGDGAPDYVVFGGGIGNGRLFPPWNVTVLLGDEQGLPLPFEAALYDEQGPKHVVDLRHNGRAQLVLSDYDEDGWDNLAQGFCSGHWTTRLYETLSLNWIEVRGTAPALTFPFVRRWTYGAKCDPSAQPQLGNEDTDLEKDLTAMPDVASARIAEVDQKQRIGGSIKLATPSGCENVSVGTVVYDQRSQREIALVSDARYPTDLLNRMPDDKAEAALRGVRRYTVGRGCSTRLLWATK